MIEIDSFSTQKKVTKLEYCQTTLRQLERLRVGMPSDTHNFQLEAIIGYFKLLDGVTNVLFVISYSDGEQKIGQKCIFIGLYEPGVVHGTSFVLWNLKPRSLLLFFDPAIRRRRWI